MTEKPEVPHSPSLEDWVLELRRDMIVLKDRVDLLENGLYSERKRHSSILRRIRKLREEPEIEELLQALSPETQQKMQQSTQNWLQNLKPGDPIPSEIFYNQTGKEQGGENK